jgi:hypothetical protein
MRKILLTLLFTFTQGAFAAEDALTSCRQIEDLEERVSCYDEFVDSRYPPGSDAVPDAQSLFGADDAEARRIVETTLAIEQLDQIEAKVTDVRQSAGDKLIVSLDNGHVWRQLDNKTLHLETGEAVVVRKARLGSFLLEKESGSRSIRVKRVD